MSDDVESLRRRRRSSVVYQIYPRSCQDSNGDGVGDLRGIRSRLGHIRGLGCDAIWMSPIFPSPNADFGYDVADYENVDPVFGDLDDLAALCTEAHRLGLEVLLDMVPCHTSIDHPWFREHPDWYIRYPGDTAPNNWLSTFGGPAWAPDAHRGGLYLHTFYQEQADLNWRNSGVRQAFAGICRRWMDRGVDGFRLDALDRLFKDDQLRDNPPADTPFALWNGPGLVDVDQRFTANLPDIFPALAELRASIPDAFLVAEAYRPTSELPPYLAHVDLAFCFEFLQSQLDPLRIAAVIDAAARTHGIAWMLSNHDFSRLVSRWGDSTARAAAVMLLTLPGAAFIYQGDEIGMVDGPDGAQRFDRFGRDGYRHPMQWTRDGGFTTGEPWLPMIDPAVRNVADQEAERSSMLWLYRDLLALRPELGDDFAMNAVDGAMVSYRRGDLIVTVNLGDRDFPIPGGRVLLRSDGRAGGEPLSAGSAAVTGG